MKIEGLLNLLKNLTSMNCQQKSGVFLNIHCTNIKQNKCADCKNEICEAHTHIVGTRDYCEDCYWELYLFKEEGKSYETSAIFIETANHTSTTFSNGTAAAGSDSIGGFKDGYGGGDFGGAGGTGAWTEGDMQSLNDTKDGQNNFLAGSDDTFFYS